MSLSALKTNMALSLSSLNTPKDILLPADAQDTISSLAWAPRPSSNFLAAASWDGKIRVYDVAADGSRAKRIEERMIGGGAPVLSCDWLKDGTALIAGGADKTLYLVDATTSQTTTLGTHTRPIKSVRAITIPSSSGGNSGGGAPLIATGSWDGTVKLWDARVPTFSSSSSSLSASNKTVATLACAERVYAMDAAGNTLVIATASGENHLVDLRKPTVMLRTVTSSLEYQARAVSVAPGGRVWATASVEGRVAVNAVDEAEEAKINFKFRCHRTTTTNNGTPTTTTNIYSVNDVHFHPTQPATFVTAGGDGSVVFWDQIAHRKVNHYEVATPAEVARGAAVTATGFSASGLMLAYAVGYDWGRGYTGNTQGVVRRLMVHRVTGRDTMVGKK